MQKTTENLKCGGSHPGIAVRPYQMLCILCRLGQGRKQDLGDRRLTRILTAVRKNPSLPITLRCNAESVYSFQNPGRSEDTRAGVMFNDKRDLDIIQKLGLVPGDTRPARELFQRIFQKIETVQGLCGFAGRSQGAWRGCARAFRGFYEKGHAAGLALVVPPRSEQDKARAKKESAAAVYQARRLFLRPHHLMCMACFHGGRKELAPIAEDNLFEAIDVIQKNPEIPVTLVRGCCMICPPCTQYDPKTKFCISASGMSLRDQKKDLDLLQRLDLEYGVTLPARELYRRLFRTIRSTCEICGYNDGLVRGWEWTICGGPEGNAGYVKARAARMFIPGRTPKSKPSARSARHSAQR